jgi:hypothetical protein
MHIDCGSVAFTVKVLVIGWRRGVTHGRPRLASLIGCGDVRSEPRLRGERGLPPSLARVFPASRSSCLACSAASGKFYEFFLVEGVGDFLRVKR